MVTTPSFEGRTEAEIARFRGVWVTSHHPVLAGGCWRFPADTTDAVFHAHEIGPRIGPVFNLELEGHVDTIVLAGDGAAPNMRATFLSSTIGKYIPSLGGWTRWTR